MRARFDPLHMPALRGTIGLIVSLITKTRPHRNFIKVTREKIYTNIGLALNNSDHEFIWL